MMPTLKCVLPTANRMDVVVAGNTTAWFNIESFVNLMDIKFGGIEDSVAQIQAIIEAEAQLVSHRKIILAGFSQGGATSLFAGLTSTLRLGGIVCLSGFLPKYESLI